ncbi:hypothetical protein CP082626L3_0609B, partial [Chlamydia psittaci 08-2626_L3]
LLFFSLDCLTQIAFQCS